MNSVAVTKFAPHVLTCLSHMLETNCVKEKRNADLLQTQTCFLIELTKKNVFKVSLFRLNFGFVPYAHLVITQVNRYLCWNLDFLIQSDFVKTILDIAKSSD